MAGLRSRKDPADTSVPSSRAKRNNFLTVFARNVGALELRVTFLSTSLLARSPFGSGRLALQMTRTGRQRGIVGRLAQPTDLAFQRNNALLTMGDDGFDDRQEFPGETQPVVPQ